MPKFLRGARIARALLATAALSTAAAFAQPAAKPTEWGWPQPYEKVSEKSVKSLLMDCAGLLKTGGIESGLTAFTGDK